MTKSTKSSLEVFPKVQNFVNPYNLVIWLICKKFKFFLKKFEFFTKFNKIAKY